MRRLLLIPLLVLTACAGTSGGGQTASERPKYRDTSAKVHTELAGLYYERSQFGVALGEIDQALQADPGYAPAYGVRGLVHMALREDKAAEDDFRQSLRIDSGDSDTRNNYGWFLCQRSREKESIAHFMAALKNPLYATPERAWLNAGLCSRKAGELKDAEEFLLRALQLQPGLTQASFEMSALSFDKGDYTAAKRYFVRFAERNDNLSAEQLWLAVRIERKLGDRNAEASYGLQLRKRFPDARETRMFMYGE
ncbi:MAG: type IV pilus biogenesis/stability protein PilW [Rhodocyclales bacterium GWA2_65_19]|nr:MAG: type IV pilus biogenesis/stability protein PilW [Rhodocyclales bacterium GWA2_65_19]